MSAGPAGEPGRISESPLVEQVSRSRGTWRLALSSEGHERLRDEGAPVVLEALGLAQEPVRFAPVLPAFLELDRDWPEIRSFRQGDHELELLVYLQPGMRWFRGHFPGEPILAGVVQLHWAGELGRRAFSIASAFRSVEVLKFQRVIRPGMEICLGLQHDPDKHRIAFFYRSVGQPCSQGRIHFGA